MQTRRRIRWFSGQGSFRVEVALRDSTKPSGCAKQMQQGKRLRGKAVQSETGFNSDFKRKVPNSAPNTHM